MQHQLIPKLYIDWLHQVLIKFENLFPVGELVLMTGIL